MRIIRPNVHMRHINKSQDRTTYVQIKARIMKCTCRGKKKHSKPCQLQLTYTQNKQCLHVHKSCTPENMYRMYSNWIYNLVCCDYNLLSSCRRFLMYRFNSFICGRTTRNMRVRCTAGCGAVCG